ncbi:class I SAM-dependent methyltransferase [Microlunatus parietis]|uniref:SAM-dependent methyltransferase n=1 Tax=Microlunatus parietis TaxID=682979 RepID=A0A7Y9I6A0_9ACTN|nr:class I SAM-dependent methyltransferase [Microlunatus parietis]NYE71062.1 SAM-dependent methyltransferase [Microlunatus parietis]
MGHAEALNSVGYGPFWSERWDAEFGNNPNTGATVDTVAALAEGTTILEWGIGTGRLALPLVEKGLKVVGVDSSPDMLGQLRGKPGAEVIELVEGDFETTRVEGDFGLVFISSHALFALTSQQAQVNCFANASAHLREGGRFVIEVMNPGSAAMENGRAWTTAVKPHALTLFFSSANPVTQQMVMCHFDIDDQGGVKLRPAASRYAWPAELDLMAIMAGLELESRWGGWDRQPFTAHSSSHVSVYRKAAEA